MIYNRKRDDARQEILNGHNDKGEEDRGGIASTEEKEGNHGQVK